MNTISSLEEERRREWQANNPPPQPQRDSDGRPVIDEKLIERQTAYREEKDRQGITTEEEYQKRKELASKL